MTDEKCLRLLEFDKILERLSQEAQTAAGRQKCLALSPESDRIVAQEQLDQTRAALWLYDHKGSFSMPALGDLSELLRRTGAGGLLSPAELCDVARVLEASRRLAAYRGEEEIPEPALDDYFVRLQGNKFFEDRVFRSFTPEGELCDAASPALGDIRRKMQQARSRVREALQKLIRSAQYQKALQDPVVTQRGGRFVVPVKVEHKGEIQGLVHDVSPSGMTLFVEPASVVEANNEIRILEGREKQEEERILAELSAAACDEAERLEEDYALLAFFDLCFAKARLAAAWKATEPRLNEQGRVVLKRARHPLIDREKVVPIDLSLGKTADTLIITGPNTGGKTVTLKTTGLLCALAASGLFIPCDDGSEIALFDRILADIGDEQSIEQSLSTFSGHMTNLVAILKKVTGRSLCLFDELGAGTDPIEGAALSQAILEEIREKGARILCTTHYPELKIYALQTEGVQNASCEFDVATLRPTYRLILGTPGRSNAFAISERLGLPRPILERAANHLDQSDVDFEKLLQRIEENRLETEKMRREAEDAERRAQETENRAKTMARDYEKKLNQELDRSRAEGKRVVASARARIDSVLDELDSLIKEKERADFKERVGAFRSKTKATLKELDNEIDPVREEKTVYVLPRPLKIGDTVEVPGIARAARVLSLPDGKGKLRVSSGSMSFEVAASSVRLIRPPREKKAYVPSSTGKAQGAGTSLNIIGKRAAEAEPEVEQFIDRAVLCNLSEVTIVHGKGTGALRQAVWDLLRAHPSVESMRLGAYGEGDAGVTVVKLKQ